MGHNRDKAASREEKTPGGEGFTMEDRQSAPEEPQEKSPSSTADDALVAARGAAQSAASRLREGVNAVRDVRAAARRHSSARARLREMT